MIKLKNVTKYFKTEDEKKYILKNITLEIPDNVNVGIVGKNGAGKSTLLRMLGGIDFPTSGAISSDKTFSWPMGLAGGFQGSMTGKQNVKFICRIYGKTEEEIETIISYVKDFADIGDYFDMPIKLYSSGMRGRLSFGLSLAFDFDYLIIDETLSVGDANFKKKATDALKSKIKSCNILLVSHSMPTLKELCNAGIVIDDGQMHYFDDIDDAIKLYIKLNTLMPVGKKDTTYTSLFNCSDGNSFDSINAIANFYEVRPMSIVQALNENNGSNIFLKKVFWRGNSEEEPFQEWEACINNKTIISSDGVIFETVLDASLFYIDRIPNAKISELHVDEVMQSDNKFSKELNLKFEYLSEYK